MDSRRERPVDFNEWRLPQPKRASLAAIRSAIGDLLSRVCTQRPFAIHGRISESRLCGVRQTCRRAQALVGAQFLAVLTCALAGKALGEPDKSLADLAGLDLGVSGKQVGSARRGEPRVDDRLKRRLAVLAD